MTTLNPTKLHVRFSSGTKPIGPIIPRQYTITHSDFNGRIFLTVGREYNLAQTKGWYTKLMRDEVYAEWIRSNSAYELHVYVHVSGGFVLGTKKWRNQILTREMPLVLQIIRNGDSALFAAHPSLNDARTFVHFRSEDEKYNRIEQFGTLGQYVVNEAQLTSDK